MWLGILMGLLCALCWAAGSVSIRNLARKLDPFTLNAPRTLAGSVLTIALLLVSGRSPLFAAVTPDKLFYLVFSIIVGAVIGDAFYVTSIARIGVSRTIPIANAYPALTLLFGITLLHEQITWPLVLGLALVSMGVILVSRRPAGDEPDLFAGRPGLPFAILAALFWAAGMVLVAPGMVGIDPLVASAIRTPALALTLAVVVVLRGSWRQYKQLTLRDWVVLVVGGAVGWGLGNTFFVSAVSLLGPTRAAILASTPPLFALPLSVFWMKEKPNWMLVAGTVVAVAGIALVS